ncbi:hypothetical protein BAUCODRAFT_29756 [Baudoinia panamericana UAMH 10762]|uniref:Uncharacterized protein n=1 Tax=Baudoinia panamericana (strain UAMH 10762) TaxID=717646 RepID=M2NP33_BAUPA|nr:uncharacterized protein BAUCODRAFT_29756 [Baudoinia panamericana UAMH 10762]EMD01310.1 hypothetical protein BAUCODRAFT_29756 [Baudoinia panamericana UAMH 10762]
MNGRLLKVKTYQSPSVVQCAWFVGELRKVTRSRERRRDGEVRFSRDVGACRPALGANASLNPLTFTVIPTALSASLSFHYSLISSIPLSLRRCSKQRIAQVGHHGRRKPA